MPIYIQQGGQFKEAMGGLSQLNGSFRDLRQVYVNNGGVWKPVWWSPSFRVGVFSFRIDDSAYATINFSTGVVTLNLNKDRRSYSNTSYLGPENMAWAPGIKGSGNSSWDWNAYVSASVYVPGLHLKPHELYSIGTCRVSLTGSGRNNPYMTQQPNESNGYVAIWKVTDPQDGPDTYDVSMWLDS